MFAQWLLQPAQPVPEHPEVRQPSRQTSTPAQAYGDLLLPWRDALRQALNRS